MGYIIVLPQGGDSTFDGMIGVQFVINSADGKEYGGI